MDVIQTLDLTKRYGMRAKKSVLAVDQISFSVKQGQVFGFLGPNGSGKTTTIGMLVGIIMPTEGSFRLFGNSDSRGLNAARA
ncbi:MAG: ATP-binding cassette domain-containing protein, partial [Rhodothermaceae bacterium]|nr:ATP-binding cassette domain-containing protein [Rhodothermaceae bacterium]